MALLPTRMIEKIWGKDRLPAPFAAPAGQRIGEVWFEPPPQLEALLVKYIFTSEKLSVQCHPSDNQAQDAGLGRNGKEECWLVIDADPGAALAVGFAAVTGADKIRAGAMDGSIEQLLQWHPVQPGDFFYLPANTVHAIGAGVSLIEIQQNSDITFRLYDYGRPRELHLEQGLAVASGEPHDPSLRRHLPGQGHVRLVDGPCFRLDRLAGPPDGETHGRYAGPLLVIPCDAHDAGSILVAGQVVPIGGCAFASGIDELEIPPGVHCLIAQPLVQGQ